VLRRDFLKTTLAASTFLPTARASSYLANSPDMLASYLNARLTALAARWDKVRDSLQTPAQVTERIHFIRDKARQMMGPFPERTALSPVVVRSTQRKGYRVENVMYQSRPNFWVTGNLYIPDGAGPFPAVLSPCGHYQLGRMYPDYQFVYMNLARAGFVVLAYDPIGQGERRQFWNPETNVAEIDDPVYEHSLPGTVLLLLGENLTGYRVWDGMRGIDYLLTRREVIPDKIACAGHSGGGTLTLFISAVDERVQCAVVNEGGTNHRWPSEIPLWSHINSPDIEQNLFPAASYGVDMCDLHQAIAPRPLLALIEHYSPHFNQAAAHIRHRYEQLGAADHFSTVEANDPHAWTVKLRLASTDWLSRWLYSRPGPTREPDFELEKPETLYCTIHGSLRYANQGESIYALMEKEQSVLPPAIRKQEVPTAIRKLLQIKPSHSPLEVQQLAPTPRKGYRIEKVEFISEPGIYVPVWVFIPERPLTNKTALLFINDNGKESDGMELGLYERLALAGRIVASADVRGIGETKPPHMGVNFGLPAYRFLFDAENGVNLMAWYMDETLFGMRVFDVLRTVDYVLGRGDVDSSGLRLIGQGAGALWAMHAAALDPRITSVVAERGLVSWRSLAQTDRYLHNAGVFIRDVLKHYDLPQVAAAIAPRPLTLLSPVDPMKRTMQSDAATEAYTFARKAYAEAGAPDSFRLMIEHRTDGVYTS
jgi:cephalosporin-C deacetylase-like acetyl esterase